jgi:ferredoxin--NADP+ reductase
MEDDRFVGSGEFSEIACGTLIAAIGYHSTPIEGAPVDERRGVIANTEGRVEPGLCVVGWAKRGPSGVISSNKPDGEQVTGQILADAAPGGKPGRAGLEKLLVAQGVSWITYEDWREIDAAEVAGAPEGAPRRKFVRVADMLSVVGKGRRS